MGKTKASRTIVREAFLIIKIGSIRVLSCDFSKSPKGLKMNSPECNSGYDYQEVT